MRDALVTAPAALPEVFDAARAQLLRRQLGSCRARHRALVAGRARTGRDALEPNARRVVSLPALGLKQTSGRLVSTIADAVGVFVGDGAQPREHNRIGHPGRIRRHLREQAILFNVATLITVAFGMIALYAAVSCSAWRPPP